MEFNSHLVTKTLSEMAKPTQILSIQASIELLKGSDSEPRLRFYHFLRRLHQPAPLEIPQGCVKGIQSLYSGRIPRKFGRKHDVTVTLITSNTGLL